MCCEIIKNIFVWRCPIFQDQGRYHVYDFLASLNSKFDVLLGHILGQMPITSFMKVCFEVCLKKDKVSATNIMTISVTDYVAFSVKLVGFDSDKQNGKQTPVCELCKKL